MTVAEPVGGGAAAIARDREGRLIDQTHPARAGERLSLWGSGLGAASNIPIEVDIGGTNASVTFHGRTEHPGLDRIDVVIPPEASGCNVSVVVVAGGVPSNFATIPIASKASRRSNEEAAGCSDPQLNPVTSAQYRRLLSAAHVRVGTSSVTSLTAASPQGVTFDSASATFERYTAAQFRSNSFLQQPSIGSCLVLLGPAMLEGQPTLLGWKFYAPLDAGPQLTVSGSDGSLALLPSFLQAYASSVEAAGAVNSVGALTLDNGSGGSDVGPFTASFGAIATPVNWTNRDEIKSLDRAGGQAITWTGGAPGSYVSVFGYSTMSVPSPLGDSLTQYIYFICTADATAGSFHIPTAVLNSLPPTAHGHLYVVNGIAKEFEAPGLDLGLLYFASGSGLEVPLL
jgi:hypothetical protein